MVQRNFFLGFSIILIGAKFFGNYSANAASVTQGVV